MENTCAEIVWFMLIAAGVLYVLTRSFVFSPVRMLISGVGGRVVRALLYCPACTGFWVGLAFWYLGLWPCYMGIGPVEIAGPLQTALATCGLGSVLGSIWGSEVIAHEIEALDQIYQAKQRNTAQG